MGPKHFQNKARREWWSIHIEAWQRSGVSRAAYCRQHRLDEGTFARWLKRSLARKLHASLRNIRRNCAARSAVKSEKKG